MTKDEFDQTAEWYHGTGIKEAEKINREGFRISGIPARDNTVPETNIFAGPRDIAESYSIQKGTPWVEKRFHKNIRPEDRREGTVLPVALDKTAKEGIDYYYSNEHGKPLLVVKNPNILLTHRIAVERAIASGRPVPASVLADYPDLAKQYAPPAEVAPAPVVWYRGEAAGGSSVGDQFWSADKGTATEFGITKVGEKPKVLTESSDNLLKGKKIYESPSKEAMQEELGTDLDWQTKEFDRLVKKTLTEKGYDGIRYKEGSLSEFVEGAGPKDELHLFGRKPTPVETGAAPPLRSEAAPTELKIGQKVYIQLPKHRHPKTGKVVAIATDETGKPVSVDVSYGGSVVDKTAFKGKKKRVTFTATVKAEDVALPQNTIALREYHKALSEIPAEQRGQVKGDAKKFDNLAAENIDRLMTDEELEAQWKESEGTGRPGEKQRAIAAYEQITSARRKFAETLGIEDIDNPVVRAKAAPMLEKYLYDNPKTGEEVQASDLQLKPGDRVKMLGEWYDVEPSETPGGYKLKDGMTVDIEDPSSPASTLYGVEGVQRAGVGPKTEMTPAGEQTLLAGTEKRQTPNTKVRETGRAVTAPINQGDVFNPDKIAKGNLPEDQQTFMYAGLHPKPVVESVGNAVHALGKTDVVDAVRKVLLPAGRGPEAMKAAESIRANLGEMNREEALAYKSVEDAQKQFDKMPPEENHAFMDAVETGSKQADPKLDAAAGKIRGILDGLRDQIQSLGTGKLEHFYENYFPHIWKDPTRAKTFFGDYGKRPFAGKGAFLKKRTIPTIKEGLESGLELVSDNPMDLVMAKVHEMRKYLMAHRVLREFKDAGMMQFVKSGHRPPEGFTLVDDRISSVTYRTEKGEMVTSGHYYLPEGAARVMNNYLSPGLRGSKTFRAYREASNILNQAQLGLSAFHLGFTSIDAATSKFAVGLNRLAKGQIFKGARDIAMTPIAPLSNAISGNRLYKAYYETGPVGAELGRFVQSMVAANGVPKMDWHYKTGITKNMVQAWRKGNPLGVALRVPGAALELAAKPIMEYIVPRQKLGVFMDMMRMEFDANPNMTAAELRPIAQKAWNSVDNRMGQLVYDNLFWNNVAKDLAMASIRSVGWNVGTVREVVGGGKDILSQVGRLTRGENPELTYRMAYITALPIVVGTMGAIANYLMTGQGPQSLKDYYFPRTGGTDEKGDPNRVSLPSYMKDLYHYSKDPVQTVRNKLHPILGLMGEMLANEDFYGTEIRNQDDPIYQQILDLGKHAAKGFEPLGFRNIERQLEVGEPLGKAAASFVGITPAPKGVNQTAAEQMANEFVREQIPVGSRTKQQAEEGRFKADIRRQYLKGNKGPLRNAYAAGKLTDREVRELVADESPLERSVKHLPIDKAMRVYEAGTDEEKETLKKMMVVKIENWARSASPEDKERLLPSVKEFLAEVTRKDGPKLQADNQSWYARLMGSRAAGAQNENRVGP